MSLRSGGRISGRQIAQAVEFLGCSAGLFFVG